jgi:hypothetical protein
MLEMCGANYPKAVLASQMEYRPTDQCYKAGHDNSWDLFEPKTFDGVVTIDTGAETC